jgi:Uma2 family endonuclease
MAMPAQPTEWTVEMVRALPDDGNRYEVLGGELFVTPAPSWTHQRAVLELALLLLPYLRSHAIGDVYIAPADVMFGPRDMVEPDLFAVPLVNGARPRAWEEVGRLLLAVEVLSPSTLHADRGRKRELYQNKGVPEYWIVDLEHRTVERWRPSDSAPETLTETLEWQPERDVPPLVIDLPGYFDREHGLAKPPTDRSVTR